MLVSQMYSSLLQHEDDTQWLTEPAEAGTNKDNRIQSEMWKN